MGTATSDRPPAALLVVKLATGNVHPMQGGVHCLGQHPWTVGVHVEPTFVTDDGLVNTAFVALALVVGLKKTKVKIIVSKIIL